jgi:hypothetical protein
LKGRTVGILLLLIIVIGIAIAAYLATNSKPAGTGIWQIDTEISNKGKQDTTEFVMSNPWRIIWKMDKYTTSGYFLVGVYRQNETGFSTIAEANAANTNSTVGVLPVEYTGSFVIRVLTSDDTEWTLVLEEFVTTT